MEQAYHIQMNQMASFCMCAIKKAYLSKLVTTNNIKSNPFKEDIKFICLCFGNWVLILKKFHIE